ncbi:MAG: peptidoglycan DD-metalloendopeptidase family protein, partial [Gallionellaceae bacterium]|nr:peptidoglycan DD-metalloendopeptidase family protein [Gallionellaceae bacterium]
DSQPQEPPVKDQPVALKLPYSAQAVAQLEKLQQTPAPAPAMAATKPEVTARTDNTAAEDDDTMPDWGLPAIGKLVGEFSESANRKGIDIAGKRGQAVMASAPGKIVYSGSGLRGYGKLIIIKHNKTYLSAYAHNDQVLVKEGQSVSKGQKIAEMGSTDTDQVKLHFEIRKLGKPVDPEKLLPLPK